jgi:hypothetical protein
MEQMIFFRSWQHALVVKEFPAYYGTQRSITMVTRDRFLSWARLTQSTPYVATFLTGGG